MKNTNSEESISLLERTGYSAGEIGGSTVFQVTTFYLTYFYTDVLGISPAHTITLFLVVRLWGAFCYPIFGYLVDHTDTRWGRFRPYFLFGAIPFALSLILCFTAPDFGTTMKIIWAYATYFLLITIAHLMAVPYFSLIAVMTQDTHERSVLTSFRAIIGFGSGLIAAMAVKPMVAMFPNEKIGYPMTMLIFSISIIAGFWFCFATAKERVVPDKNGKKYKAKEALTLFLKNREVLLLSITNLLFLFVITFKNAATIYYFKYYLHQENLMALFLGATGLPGAIGVIITPFLSKKYSKRNATIAGLALFGVSNIVIFFLPPSDIVLIFVLSALANIFLAICAVTVNSMLPDTVEYGEWKTGTRTEGIIISFFNSFATIAFAVGGALVGVFLSATGYIANQVPTDSAMIGIRSMFTLIPAGLCIFAIFIISLYKLDDVMFNKILQEIQNRKSMERK